MRRRDVVLLVPAVFLAACAKRRSVAGPAPAVTGAAAATTPAASVTLVISGMT